MIFFLSHLEMLFLSMIAAVTIVGCLIGIVEPYLPVFLAQSFRYGKFSLKEGRNHLVGRLEVPKSSFKHFYVFAFLWSTTALYLVLRTCVAGRPAPESVIDFLDFFCGKSRTEKSTPLETLLVTICMFAQCTRRFWETHFLQIFSRSSRINIAHYLVGYIHYFGALVAILGHAQGFVITSGSALVSREQFTWRIIISTAVFAFAWWHQWRSNVILARLRTDSNGNVVTEKHLMPTGGFFEIISSPHMMFECLIYLSLIPMLPGNALWLLICAWVIANQTQVAHLTHIWYKETFPKYPKQRRAIIPWVF
ncbi:polyprenol reductase-like [Phlebotomus papatasi]|uniref:polyprenol reductase-like n=1 Tax=Phlebotomus papatasi TaxID=29031 RepID=UPI00248378E9|nr:polyprenol reductase-like [Phlebotomus papatasi]